MKSNQRSTLEKLKEFSLMIIISLSIFLMLFSLVIESQTPLDEEQQHELDVKEATISNDFSTVTNIENTKISIEKEFVVVELNAKDCKMVLKYNKAYNLISKDFVDTRIHTDPLAWIGFGSLGIITGFLIWEILWLIISCGIRAVLFIKRRTNKHS